MSLNDAKMVSLVGSKIVAIDSGRVDANTFEFLVTGFDPIQRENTIVDGRGNVTFLNVSKFMRDNRSAFVSRRDCELDNDNRMALCSHFQLLKEKQTAPQSAKR